MPRVVAGMIVGAGLACAGVVFQAVLRNPLADPYIIGTAAGASLGAVIALLLPIGAIGWLGIGAVQAGDVGVGRVILAQNDPGRPHLGPALLGNRAIQLNEEPLPGRHRPGEVRNRPAPLLVSISPERR